MPDAALLQSFIRKILARGKGILAADESGGTIKKRFASIGIESTETARRDYRNMLFTTEGYESFISGVILFDETVDQKNVCGMTFSELIASKGVVPGIKTDEGKEEHPNWGPQTVTRGLKGLGKRLEEYTQRSCGTLRFTKWRQVILVEPEPTDSFLDYASHMMAEQAAWSIAKGCVPICEPEVLMDGSHTMKQCAEVTERTLTTLYRKLREHGVDPALTILKTNMVLSGKGLKKDAPEEVAEATLAVFQKSLPKELPGIVFLSGGQSAVQATENLNAITNLARKKGRNGLPAVDPAKRGEGWILSFSYGRALQDDALKTWGGRSGNAAKAQAAFLHRARMNGLAQKGEWKMEMEGKVAKEPMGTKAF